MDRFLTKARIHIFDGKRGGVGGIGIVERSEFNVRDAIDDINGDGNIVHVNGVHNDLIWYFSYGNSPYMPDFHLTMPGANDNRPMEFLKNAFHTNHFIQIIQINATSIPLALSPMDSEYGNKFLNSSGMRTGSGLAMGPDA